MITDPISNMLTQIRNALMRKAEVVNVPASRLKENIAQTLVSAGYLSKVETVKEEGEHPVLKITLKYYADEPVIHGLKRISKPGQRIYSNISEMHKIIRSGSEELVVSTSKGLMMGRAAKKLGLGGEVLFKVW